MGIDDRGPSSSFDDHDNLALVSHAEPPGRSELLGFSDKKSLFESKSKTFEGSSSKFNSNINTSNSLGPSPLEVWKARKAQGARLDGGAKPNKPKIYGGDSKSKK